MARHWLAKSSGFGVVKLVEAARKAEIAFYCESNGVIGRCLQLIYEYQFSLLHSLASTGHCTKSALLTNL